MAKKFTASSSQLKPDPKFSSRIAAKFINCLMLDGKIFTPEGGRTLSFFGTFACLGIGPSYFVLILKMFSGFAGGNIESFTYAYRNLFVLTAGLMNILLIIDAFDIAKGRK